MSHFSALRGFRLQHFSTFNWGTFDGAIVTLSPEQSNSLLTGNIGSGKSTLVDGLTT
ncbi:ATP-binding protein [Vibrio breoganii]|nr:ATP-binding protein [Vibrio breoganii]